MNHQLTREDLTKTFIKTQIEQFQNPSSITQKEIARRNLARAREILTGDPEGYDILLLIADSGIPLREVTYYKD